MEIDGVGGGGAGVAIGGLGSGWVVGGAAVGSVGLLGA